MTDLAVHARRIAVGVGCCLLGAAMATAAHAAPVDAGPPTSPSRAPVPALTRPVDASDGLFGVRRGTLPGLATPDLPQAPVVDGIPDLEIVPLPEPTPATPDPTG